MERVYIPAFQAMMGLSAAEAKKQFREMLAKVKQAAQQDGMADLPEGYGDILFQRAQSEKWVTEAMEKLRQEGATDQDIRWWYNLHELERRMLSEVDDMVHIAHFIALRREGLEVAEAAARVKMHHPYYGSPDESSATGEDRLLPFALKDRVSRWIESHAKTPWTFDLGELKTFNALVRCEIRNGTL